jgi:ribokinase
VPESGSPAVFVLGSVHMDLIASASRLPAPGESVTGGQFAMAPGGKGGNQASQLACYGIRTFMVSRVGDDLFGRELITALSSYGVDTSFVGIDRLVATGASTVLSAQGDYASIIAPGAAAALSRQDVDRAATALNAAKAVVLQLELPLPVNLYAATIAASKNKLVVLNASPAPDSRGALPDALWQATGVLVVNRVEAERLLGTSFTGQTSEKAALKLSENLGIETVVITLGEDGAVAAHGGKLFRQPAFHAEVVDTVGAGDAFLGVLTAGLIEGESLPEALRRAAAAGALAVGKRGAFDALSRRSDIEQFLDRQP